MTVPNLWLILPEATPPIEQAYARAPLLFVEPSVRDAAKAASDALKAVRAASELKVVKGEAQIRVVGPLLAESDWVLDYFGVGYSTYADIRSQLAKAKDDSDVTSLELQIDSPGGMVSGLFDLLADLEAFPKPKRSTAALAASAAYAIAANGGKITGSAPLATFGSIGVVASYYPSSYIDVTSTAAPDKRPDPKTEQGRAVIRAYLDEIHDLFATAIASGRGTSAAHVNAEYGGGRVFTAGPALARGLIDSIAGESGGNKAHKAAKGTKMDINTLKAEHPALYAQVFAAGEAAGQATGMATGQAAGMATGQAIERARVTDHLKLGESIGKASVAHAAIRDGKSVTDALADYHAAKLAGVDQDVRLGDDKALAKALDGHKTEQNSNDAKDDAFVAAFQKHADGVKKVY